MALNPFGRYRPKPVKKAKPTLGVAQPGAVPTLPTVKVRQDALATSPPNPAGGQGPVVTPGSESAPKVTGTDVSYKDSLYNQGESNIQTGLNNLAGYLTGTGNQLGLDYGIDTGGASPTTYDPAHPPAFNVDWGNVDVTNPNSRAALLVRVHKQNVRGNTNSMAARGQLYAGSLQNAQDTEGFQYQAGQDSLFKDFGSKWGGLYGQWLQATQAGDQQRLDNTAAALDRNKDTMASPPPINPALVDWFKTHSLRGDKWVDNTAAPPAPKPAAKATVDPKQWLATHKLVGGKWVKK